MAKGDPQMTLQQLVYAVEAYRRGSITSAAQALYMAQPNLSAAIRELEKEIGYLIFVRTKNGIECTERGKEFILLASDIVSRFENLNNLHGERDGQTHMLSIVTARSSEICDRARRYANAFIEEGRLFKLQFKESTNLDVIYDVVSGNSDIGIIRANTNDVQYFFHLAESKGLRLQQLPPAPYVLLFSKNHPLADEPVIAAEMLEPYTEVIHGDYEMPMYPYSNYHYHSFLKTLDKKNVIFVTDRGSLMDMLSGVYGSYVWTSTTHQSLKDAYSLVERECSAPPVMGTDAIVTDKSRPITTDMQGFIDLLLSESEK